MKAVGFEVLLSKPTPIFVPKRSDISLRLEAVDTDEGLAGRVLDDITAGDPLG